MALGGHEMSRKGKLELRPHQSHDDRAAASFQWRDAVARLLSAAWDSAGKWQRATNERSYVDLAADVVGMFDAGARDAEAAVFLREQEVAAAGAPWHSDEARLALAAELHRAAAARDVPGVSKRDDG